MIITISPPTATIALGSTLQLSASKPCYWQSHCPAIAKVDQNGLVQATSGTYFQVYRVIGGEVRITAQELNAAGQLVGTPAICVITVLSTQTEPATRCWNGNPQNGPQTWG